MVLRTILVTIRTGKVLVELFSDVTQKMNAGRKGIAFMPYTVILILISIIYIPIFVIADVFFGC
jgi:hypothetical protein